MKSNEPQAAETDWQYEAETLLEEGQLEAAREHYQKAADNKTTRVQGMIGLGRVALMGEDFKQAASFLDEARKLDPRNAEARLWRGLIHERQGEHGPALECYRQAVELNADDASTRLCYGRALLEDSKWDQAEVQLQAAVHLDPQNPMVYYLLGCVFLNSGRRSDAVLRFSKAIEVDPSFAESYDALGGLFIDLGRVEEGCRVLRTGLSRLGDERGDECLRVLVKAAGTLEDFRSATEFLRPRVSQSEQYQQFCIDLGRRALEQGQLEQAATIVEALLEACPHLAEAHLERGILHERHDQTESAIVSFRQAHELDPKSWEIACRLGRLLLQETPAKDVEQGLGLLKLAAELSPQEPRAAWELAQGYLKAGRADRARRAALKVTRMPEASESMAEQARDLLRRLPAR